MTSRTSRRLFLGTAALAAPGLALGTGSAGASDSVAALRQATASQSREVYGTAAVPEWTFTVHDYQDPYSGKVTRPESAPPRTRYIGADVQIDNESEQAMSFERYQVRLRDSSGYEYSAGSTFGDAPALDGRTLNPGERARGWVWYTVGTDAKITEIVLTASSPQFRVEIKKK